MKSSKLGSAGVSKIYFAIMFNRVFQKFNLLRFLAVRFTNKTMPGQFCQNNFLVLTYKDVCV